MPPSARSSPFFPFHILFRGNARSGAKARPGDCHSKRKENTLVCEPPPRGIFFFFFHAIHRRQTDGRRTGCCTIRSRRRPLSLRRRVFVRPFWVAGEAVSECCLVTVRARRRSMGVERTVSRDPHRKTARTPRSSVVGTL